MESDYLRCFEAPLSFDESTIRKKLKEYENLGIAAGRKDGKTVVYTLCKDNQRWVPMPLPFSVKVRPVV